MKKVNIIACILFCAFLVCFLLAGVMSYADIERSAAWELVSFVCLLCAMLHAVIMQDEDE